MEIVSQGNHQEHLRRYKGWRGRKLWS